MTEIDLTNCLKWLVSTLQEAPTRSPQLAGPLLLLQSHHHHQLAMCNLLLLQLLQSHHHRHR